MTAPTRALRTPAEGELIERFGAAQSILPGSAKVKAIRAEAFSVFERHGLPHRRIEEWKYSDLRARLKRSVALAEKPDLSISTGAFDAALDAYAGLDRYRLVIVDGFFVPDLSDQDALSSEGVEVSDLSQLLAADDARSAELMAVPEIAGDDVAVALNSAFASGGVVISIVPGAQLTKPIEIVYVATPTAATSVHARNSVVIGDSAEATILETSLGGVEECEINLATLYRLGDGAKLTIARLQSIAFGATQIASNFFRLGDNAQLKHLSVEAGSDFSRNQSFVDFAGEHASAEIFGASMLHGDRHIDQTLIVDHAVANCRSAELFKTVIDDRASGVFQGKIVVRPDAQKTSGKMMSQALLLSEEAVMSAKPELEIFADDVVCGHGATSGQIDSEMLFYLMARGIPRHEAERLLIEAFLAEAVEAIGDIAIGDALKSIISAWSRARGASGK